MNFDEMILEAAKSIIAATSALVRAASAAQRELIDQVILCLWFLIRENKRKGCSILGKGLFFYNSYKVHLCKITCLEDPARRAKT